MLNEFERMPQSAVPVEENPESQPQKSGWADKIRQAVNSQVAETPLPTEQGLGYKSTMNFYGGKLIEDEGKMVYDMSGWRSKFDVWGDKHLRALDDHTVKNPGELLRRRPKAFLKTLPFVAEPKRLKGGPDKVLENVKKFGLEEYYGPHQKGIEIKKPELFTHGVPLQDIYRQDQINSELLNQFDRFEAVGTAGSYLNELHQNHGAVGEFNVYVVLFDKHSQNKVDKPVLIIPAMGYNPKVNIGEKEQKATDLLDFLASVGSEEWRRTKDLNQIKHALAAALSNYGDAKVISLTKSLAKRGRLTMPGDEEIASQHSLVMRKSRGLLGAHTKQRLHIQEDGSALIRQLIIQACQDKQDKLKPDETAE